MSREEEIVRSVAQALAGTVTEVRPLRLDGGPRQLPARRWRRWRRWAAPAAAAAAVAALAVSLVIIRQAPNGGGVPPAGPAHPNGGAHSAGGVPRYFAELTPYHGSRKRQGLLVGDTFTGKTVATVAPPAGATFRSVSAAAGDRTFAVLAEPARGGPGRPGSWYLLRLAPGTSSSARLTRMPVKAVPDVTATALSRSGGELAVARAITKAGKPWLGIYSVTTGRLLRSWSGGPFGIGTSDSGRLGAWMPQSAALAWTRGDRAITFLALNVGVSASKKTGTSWSSEWNGFGTLRRLDITTGSGDLAKDSKVIWSPLVRKSPVTRSSLPSGCKPGSPGCVKPPPASISDCPLELPAVSTDGKTAVCVTVGSQVGATVRWKVTWTAYQAVAPTVPRVLCQVSVPAGQDDGLSANVLWAGPSGTGAIVGWYLGNGHGTVIRSGVGMVRKGVFTPLPVPVSDALRSGPPNVAW